MSSSISSSKAREGGPFRLLLRILCFGSIVLICLVGVAMVSGRSPHADYHHSFKQKEARLQALGSPKLVVVGGSNAAFGINSGRLENAVCIPAVNMALHASLGLDLMTEQIAGAIGQGDVILLSMEPGMFTSGTGELAIATALDGHPPIWHHAPTTVLPHATSLALVARLQSAWRHVSRWNTPPHRNIFYLLESFDERGDIVLPAEIVATDVNELEVRREEKGVEPRIPGQLERLREIAEARGARLFFVWPSVSRSSSDPAFNRSMAECLHHTGIATLGDADRSVFLDTAFLDTPFHLRPWGKEERTGRLIKDLCATLPGGCCQDR